MNGCMDSRFGMLTFNPVRLELPARCIIYPWIGKRGTPMFFSLFFNKFLRLTFNGEASSGFQIRETPFFENANCVGCRWKLVRPSWFTCLLGFFVSTWCAFVTHNIVYLSGKFLAFLKEKILCGCGFVTELITEGQNFLTWWSTFLRVTDTELGRRPTTEQFCKCMQTLKSC